MPPIPCTFIYLSLCAGLGERLSASFVCLERTRELFDCTSILSSPKIDGVVTPPEDHLLMKSVKEPATSLKSPKIKTTDELENSLKIASTFGMEKCQVKCFLLGI